MLAESFYGAINAWCGKWHKRYTAHLKGEENIFFQIPCSGSCFQQLKQVNLPAVDALERYPGNPYFPRIASSVSRQFSDGACLAEALGGSGWGLTPEDVERYVDHLAGCGIDHFALHLWQYEKNSASIRDWPPNIPMGLAWREAMPALLARLRKRWARPIPPPDTLVIGPVRGCMAAFDPREAMALNEHNGDGVPDTPAGRVSRAFSALTEGLHAGGLSFDVTEERIVERYDKIEKGRFLLGRAAYRRVIVGEGCMWENMETLCALREHVECLDAARLSWQFEGAAGPNQFPLFLQGEKRTAIPYQGPLRGLCVRVQDEVKSVAAQGIPLARKAPQVFCLPDNMTEAASGVLELTVEPLPGGEQAPLGFLEGNFLVRNRKGYAAHDARQWRAEDAFYLSPMTPAIDCGDLTAAGFPFCGAGVYVTALRYIGRDGALRLGRPAADAARVWAMNEAGDCQELGWAWGPDWTVETNLPEGFCAVRVLLCPSAYNSYGPHHDYRGDRPLVSPAQYEGKKNFADAPDAPACTLVPEWHGVRFGISS